MSIFEERRREAKTAAVDTVRGVGLDIWESMKSAFSEDTEAENEDAVIEELLLNAGSALLNGAVQLGKLGFSRLTYLLKERPISFESFLRFTGMYFDRLIPETCAQEKAKYVGGKLRIIPDGEEASQVEAMLYFLTPEREWITKECESRLLPGQLTDWDTNPELEVLRDGGILEYPIEAPETE